MEEKIIFVFFFFCSLAQKSFTEFLIPTYYSIFSQKCISGSSFLYKKNGDRGEEMDLRKKQETDPIYNFG